MRTRDVCVCASVCLERGVRSAVGDGTCSKSNNNNNNAFRLKRYKRQPTGSDDILYEQFLIYEQVNVPRCFFRFVFPSLLFSSVVVFLLYLLFILAVTLALATLSLNSASI